MNRYVRGGWARKYQSGLRENVEAPMTKVGAKVNVCHPEKKEILVLMQQKEREGDRFVYRCGGEERGGCEREFGLLRQHIQTLNYMSVHEHIGGSVCINTLTNTTAALGWTLGAQRRFSASSLTNKIHSVSIREI